MVLVRRPETAGTTSPWPPSPHWRPSEMTMLSVFMLNKMRSAHLTWSSDEWPGYPRQDQRSLFSRDKSKVLKLQSHFETRIETFKIPIPKWREVTVNDTFTWILSSSQTWRSGGRERLQPGWVRVMSEREAR